MTARIVLSLGLDSPVPNDVYLAALSRPGLDLEVCRISPETDPAAVRDLVAGSAGLVLSGGPDVHPARYGEQPGGADMRYVSEARDAVELAALAAADDAGLPVLAICRGAQVLNVHRGGGLLQHIGQDHRDRREQPEKWRPFHGVNVEAGTLSARTLDAAQVWTNSRHHQALNPARIGAGLRVTGRCATDGLVEMVEGDGSRFVLGVQWHPENMATAASDSPERAQARRLFEAFARAAHERR